ncbi:hypothetical protein ATANTOWER_014875 [Ataeniobius toweri]|uniref:Uncharacterized protein n=1 Tax=Ataeniobius toweri TaxID=208326 RepID=A0ABU7AYQ4_9TELE|nr:hypothetical protein [Ataeniobius toweri]
MAVETGSTPSRADGGFGSCFTGWSAASNDGGGWAHAWRTASGQNLAEGVLHLSLQGPSCMLAPIFAIRLTFGPHMMVRSFVQPEVVRQLGLWLVLSPADLTYIVL